MGFVSVGLDSFRETRANHIVVRISTRCSFSSCPSRVPFSLSSAYNWIYQVKVGTNECHANVRVANDDDTYRSVGTSTDPRETRMSNIGWYRMAFAAESEIPRGLWPRSLSQKCVEYRRSTKSILRDAFPIIITFFFSIRLYLLSADSFKYNFFYVYFLLR